jgi:AcrR family transcriptional regulator
MKKVAAVSTAPRRRYRSQKRTELARGTRRAILDAGRRLFSERGYAATTMRAVAGAAGVAESTTYKVFTDKATLLWAIAADAVAGNEAGASEQLAALVAAIRSEPDPRGRLRHVARWSRGTYERGIADIERVIEEAAGSDPQVARLARRAADERYQVARMITQLVAEVVPSAHPGELDRIAQLVWALDSSPVYRMLVEHHHWTPEQYEAAMFHLYCALLPDATAEP